MFAVSKLFNMFCLPTGPSAQQLVRREEEESEVYEFHGGRCCSARRKQVVPFAVRHRLRSIKIFDRLLRIMPPRDEFFPAADSAARHAENERPGESRSRRRGVEGPASEAATVSGRKIRTLRHYFVFPTLWE